MDSKRPFWNLHCWKSIGFFQIIQVICYWGLDLISNAKLKLVSGYWKIQYGHQVGILNVTSLKINRVWPMATNNMVMKFETEIPKQTWVMLQKPCQLQTDRWIAGRTRWILHTPHQLCCVAVQIDPKNHTHYFDGLAQDCSNSSAIAVELLQSCTKPLICSLLDGWGFGAGQ